MSFKTALGTQEAVQKNVSPPGPCPHFYLSFGCSKYLISLPHNKQKRALFFFLTTYKKGHPFRYFPTPCVCSSKGKVALVVFVFPPFGQAFLPHNEDKNRQYHMQPNHGNNGGVKATVVRGH